MKITIESTDKIVELVNNDAAIPARIWEGETESGIKVHCYITRIAVDNKETRLKEFEKELKEQRVPTPDIFSLPARLIL
jgi:hypothetical protein